MGLRKSLGINIFQLCYVVGSQTGKSNGEECGLSGTLGTRQKQLDPFHNVGTLWWPVFWGRKHSQEWAEGAPGLGPVLCHQQFDFSPAPGGWKPTTSGQPGFVWTTPEREATRNRKLDAYANTFVAFKLPVGVHFQGGTSSRGGEKNFSRGGGVSFLAG